MRVLHDCFVIKSCSWSYAGSSGIVFCRLCVVAVGKVDGDDKWTVVVAVEDGGRAGNRRDRR